ncbi:ArdC-like ssDNA-binding domain-containing protein [Chamaesiphon sp.]|uniref:ArdC-like ssDNA-binding domain-containing protein n=1 Tax=Chamaesiphon sp. TaxID=2814140 RepID=UPI00359426AA
MAKSKPPAVDKNQLVVDQLIALLESGVKPWARPWKSTKDSRDFQNLFTRKAYSGINPLLCQIIDILPPLIGVPI